MKANGTNHSGLCVRDLDATIRFFTKAPRWSEARA